MSLLERIRSGTDSGPLNLLLWAVVATFVFWGAGMSGGGRTQTIATVNGERIDGIEFSRAYDVAERRMASARTEPLTEDDRAGLRERVIQDLIRQRALVQEAEEVGLEVSDAEVAEALLDIEFLVNDEGRFDQRAYQQFLRRQGKTRGDFEADLRDQLLVEKLQELMILGATVSEPIVKRSWVVDNTMLDLEYVRVRPSAFRSELTPDDATLDAWVAEHGPDIQARYERDLDRLYDRPETLDVTMIRLTAGQTDKGLADLKADAESLKAEIEAGADMGQLAIDRSDDPSAAQGGAMTGLEASSLDAAVAAALQIWRWVT